MINANKAVHILVKIHKSKFRDVIALCDSNLIGKKIEGSRLQLDITERFYKGQPMSEQEVMGLLRDAENVNAVGKLSVRVAIKVGIVHKDNVIKIKGIPHALYTTIE